VRGEGLVRIGISTTWGDLNVGMDQEGWGYGGSGVLVHTGKFEECLLEDGTVSSFGMGDVIGCLVEFNINHCKEGKGKISFFKNGIALRKGFDIPKAAVASSRFKSFFPTVTMKMSECELNFGATMSGSTKNCENFTYPTNDKSIFPYQSLTYVNGGTVNPRFLEKRENITNGPLVIVIEPTKDLAQQTYQTFLDLSGRLSEVKCQLMIGGQVKDYDANKVALSNVDIVIGTPGKVASCLCTGSLNTSRCKLLILDEADQIAKDKTWTYAIYTIFSNMHMGKSAFDRFQVAFFSATLHSRPVKDLAKKICHRPLYIDLRDRLLIPDTIHECVVNVEPKDEDVPEGVVTDGVHRGGQLDDNTDIKCLSEADLKSEQVKLLKPIIVRSLINELQMQQVLIFCRSSLDCDLLGQYLNQRDKRVCRVLAGSKSTEERRNNLMLFQSGGCQVLLCTDAGARGLNIDSLPFVINLTLPNKPETYIHR
jgi:ATP-dependent RNA helicase DDX1